MLGFYTKYNFILTLHKPTQLKLNVIKFGKYNILLQKLKFAKLNQLTNTHLVLLNLYKNYFFKIAVKKKSRKTKMFYFKQYQQYIY